VRLGDDFQIEDKFVGGKLIGADSFWWKPFLALPMPLGDKGTQSLPRAGLWGALYPITCRLSGVAPWAVG
jgi:hypothetical protein